MADQPNTGPRSEPTTYNILFVCTGNTCRSPMAEAIGRDEVRRRGWSHVSVASAGIMAGPGLPAAANAAVTAAEHGLDLNAHASRQLTPELIDWADLILTMSSGHIAAVHELGGASKVAMITRFLDGDEAGRPIADPYGSDLETYRRAFAELRVATEAVLSRLEPIVAP